jgi:NADH dehydrogenase
MTETVLVVGGTGQLGAPAVRQLRGDGYRVRVLARRLPPARDRDADMDYVQGDLEDTAALRSALAGCAAVHLSVRGGPSAESYDRVEHRGTARVAELAALAGVGRLTYVSHTLAAPDAAAPSLRAKFRAEQAIAASAVPFTIFRPTYFMETLPRQVRGSRAVVLGRQPHPFHLLAASDFARMVSRALTTPESAGRRLDVHGPEPVTIADALRIYCARLAPGTRVVTRPLWFMTVLDRTVLGGQLSGTLELMGAMEHAGERGDPSQANRLLGAPTTTLLQWCEQQRTEIP